MSPLKIGLIGAALLAAGPALAQLQQLPSTSRGEQNVNSINRSMMTEQQNRGIAQQNQIETNSLRMEQSRPPVSLPSPVVPGAVNPRGLR